MNIEEELKKLAEIIRLLDEAYKHWEETGDGHCKSSEGAVDVHFDTYFARRDGDAKLTCSVYSYVLGPYRLHEFDSLDEALVAVREWHHDEFQPFEF